MSLANVDMPLPRDHWSRYRSTRVLRPSKGMDLSWSVGAAKGSLIGDEFGGSRPHLGIFGVDQGPWETNGPQSEGGESPHGQYVHIQAQIAEMMSMMTSQLCQRTAPQYLAVTLIDPFNKLSTSLSDWPHIDRDFRCLGQTPADGDMKQAMKEFLNELETYLIATSERVDAATKVSSKKTVIVIDRLDTLLLVTDSLAAKAQAKRIRKHLFNIMNKGDETGTYFAISSADPSTTTIPEELRSSFRRIGFRSSKRGSILTIGDPQLSQIDPKNGTLGKYLGSGPARWFKAFDLTAYQFGPWD